TGRTTCCSTSGARNSPAGASGGPPAPEGCGQGVGLAAATPATPRRPAVAAAHRGTRHTEEARRKMSAAQRRRGARPPKAGRPWTAEEDALLRALPAKQVVGRTGRTLSAVWSRRQALGILLACAEEDA